MDKKLWYVRVSFFKEDHLINWSNDYIYIVKAPSEKEAQSKVLSEILSHKSVSVYTPYWYIEEIIETPYEV